MKTLLILLLFQVNSHSERIKGYHTKKGTTVQSYRRTSPNHTTRDNYSHKGNTNPYTGKEGHINK